MNSTAENYHCSDCCFVSSDPKDFNYSDGCILCLECASKHTKEIEEHPVALMHKNRIMKRKMGRFHEGLMYDYSPEAIDFEKARREKLLDDGIFPKDVISFLNKHIVGQEKAKNKISVAICNHIQRINNPSKKIQKSNILLMGPSGSGKTEMFRHLSKFLNVPFATFDATTLTASGYVGMDVDQILVPLLGDEENPYLAQKGIVFIDEIDKLAGGSQESSVNTIRVQQELLKLIEGSVVRVNKTGDKSRPQYIDLDTSNILFICAGAFQGLDKMILNQESSDDKVIGIGGQKNNTSISGEIWQEQVQTKHLVKYGIITELLGRLPILAYTQELQKNDLMKILSEPENNLLKQYQDLFATYNVQVSFNKNFLEEIASQAYDQKIGARGLKRILEKSIENLLLEVHEYYGKNIELDSGGEIKVQNVVELYQS